MLSRFTPFSDLVKPENLNKMNIDRRIVPYFVALMHKMQKHFEQKGYLNANNYAVFFNEYLLTQGAKQFVIKFSSDISDKIEGFYNLTKKEICINEKFYQKATSEKIEEVMYHEFIHFIAKTTLPYIEQENGTFIQSGERYIDQSLFDNVFIIEAFTESMTQKLYPKSNSYAPHVKMIEYSNFIHGSINNYFLFLRGQIPGVKKYSDEFENFKMHAKLYNAQEYSNGFSMQGAENNKNYMTAQKILTDIFAKSVREEIETFSFLNVYDYVKRVAGIVEVEPVKTRELEHLVEDLNVEFLNQYFRFSVMTQKDKSVALMKLNRLISLSKKVFSGASDAYRESNSYLKTNVEVFHDEIAITFNSETITLKKGHNQSQSFSYTSFYGGVKTRININVSVFNDQLMLAYGAPVNTSYRYDISQTRHDKATESLRNEIKEVEQYFSLFRTQNYAEVRKIFKKDKNISTICTVDFPDDEESVTNFYITDGIYNEKKLWFTENGMINFATLNSISSEYMSQFISKRQIDGKEVQGMEFEIENRMKFFAYRKDNEFAVAKIHSDGRLIKPVIMTGLYEEDKLELFSEKYLNMLKLNSKNDRVLN